MNLLFRSCRALLLGIFFTLLITPAGFSDEWKPRHPLVPPNGIMNLSEPPPPSEVFFPGPQVPADAAGWLEGLKTWRADRKTRIRYDDSQFHRPELEWTQHIFSQVQLLIWDKSLYDPEKREYTVDRFLSQIEKRLGPIDAVLIWHVYPNLGLDDRNQLDLLRDLPGGVAGIRHMVQQFHDRGVRVFFPFLAWDTGTREEGSPAPVALSQLLKDVDADGINFDTLESAPAQFREASDAIGHPLALEPQFDIRDASIAYSNIGWNDWVTWEGVDYPFIPMVSKDKWFEPLRTSNVTDRFTRDKTDSLQHAFFNGQGYATLENLWGFWFGSTPRDSETILRITRIERAFAKNLVSAEWQPHVPTLQTGVFATRFPSAENTLWTIVNRNEFDVAGEQLRLPHRAGLHYYDLWNGTELIPAVQGSDATLTFKIEGHGFAAVLATDSSPSGAVKDLLAFMAERSKRPLSSYSKEWQAVPQTIVDIPRTKAAAAAPAGMVRVPEGDFDFQVRGVEIEGGNDPGVDVQYPWEDAARRSHRHPLHMASFYIDRTPVTNAEFKKFLDSAHYRPADDHNFLRNWQNGNIPTGSENKPVSWISIEDARAYAAWAGKRLPHEWEWQYAAQSSDGRIYPWGNDWKPEATGPVSHARSMPPLEDVGTRTQGASPFGVLDLTGSVLQWTDEYRDEHTRAAIVRGGSTYQPAGSVWYFPQTYRLDEHQKLLLMSPGRDRAGTIGFRCVQDAQ